jgi:hypothetical protein
MHYRSDKFLRKEESNDYTVTYGNKTKDFQFLFKTFRQFDKIPISYEQSWSWKNVVMKNLPLSPMPA